MPDHLTVVSPSQLPQTKLTKSIILATLMEAHYASLSTVVTLPDELSGKIEQKRVGRTSTNEPTKTVARVSKTHK